MAFNRLPASAAVLGQAGVKNAATGVLCVAVVALLVYLLLVLWAAKRDVAASPRKPMFLCDIHGALPEDSTFTVFDDLEVQMTDGTTRRQPLRVCPICFENKIKEAKK